MCCKFKLCCGFDLKFGSLLMITLYFLLSVIILVYKVVKIEYYDNITTGNVTVLACTILGFIGVLEKKGIFLIPFLICHIVVSIITIVSLFANFVINGKSNNELPWVYFLLGFLSAFFWYSACGIYSCYALLELKKRERECAARSTSPGTQLIPFVQTSP